MYALQVADIGAFLTGSTIPKLTQANMQRIPVPAPPVPATMPVIASILSALDDKIELNRRMNATLEVMARAIFTLVCGLRPGARQGGGARDRAAGRRLRRCFRMGLWSRSWESYLRVGRFLALIVLPDS